MSPSCKPFTSTVYYFSGVYERNPLPHSLPHTNNLAVTLSCKFVFALAAACVNWFPRLWLYFRLLSTRQILYVFTSVPLTRLQGEESDLTICECSYVAPQAREASWPRLSERDKNHADAFLLFLVVCSTSWTRCVFVLRCTKWTEAHKATDYWFIPLLFFVCSRTT